MKSLEERLEEELNILYRTLRDDSLTDKLEHRDRKKIRKMLYYIRFDHNFTCAYATFTSKNIISNPYFRSAVTTGVIGGGTLAASGNLFLYSLDASGKVYELTNFFLTLPVVVLGTYLYRCMMEKYTKIFTKASHVKFRES